MLETRFYDSSSHILSMLKLLYYIINDVQWCKDLIDYIQNVVLYEKNADIVVNNHSQVLLTYEHMNDKLHLHLFLSTNKSIIENLIETVNTQKNI